MIKSINVHTFVSYLFLVLVNYTCMFSNEALVTFYNAKKYHCWQIANRSKLFYHMREGAHKQNERVILNETNKKEFPNICNFYTMQCCISVISVSTNIYRFQKYNMCFFCIFLKDSCKHNKHHFLGKEDSEKRWYRGSKTIFTICV